MLDMISDITIISVNYTLPYLHTDDLINKVLSDTTKLLQKYKFLAQIY
jgi:hypothetical protein